MTLTREPSGRRASQIGEASSTRRPTWLTMRWQMFISCWLSRNRTLVSWILPLTSMKVRLAPLTMMSAMSREPSGRRASQIGEASSTRRPTWLTMRWQMFISCWLSRNRTLVSWILPLTSMKVRLAPLTMMSAMSSRASSGSSGP